MLRRKVKVWGKNIDKNKINFEEKNVIPANRNSLVIFTFFCGGGILNNHPFLNTISEDQQCIE